MLEEGTDGLLGPALELGHLVCAAHMTVAVVPPPFLPSLSFAFFHHHLIPHLLGDGVGMAPPPKTHPHV